MTPAYVPRRMTGLSNMQTGKYYHAVPEGADMRRKALCKTRPGMNTRGWSHPGDAVTCVRCLLEIERLREVTSETEG